MKNVSLPLPDCASYDEQNCRDFRFFCVAPDDEKTEKTAKKSIKKERKMDNFTSDICTCRFFSTAFLIAFLFGINSTK